MKRRFSGKDTGRSTGCSQWWNFPEAGAQETLGSLEMKPGEENGEDTNPNLGPSARFSIIMASLALLLLPPHNITEQQKPLT